MIAYSYDKTTKEFTGEAFCQPDPLDGGFLIPGHATNIKPEQPKEGHVMVFKDEGWVEVEDNRGQIWNIKDRCSIFWDEVGPIPKDYTKDCPKNMDYWDKENNKWTGHDEGIKAQFEYELTYEYKRSKGYPPLLDQLDALYWDKINGTNNWVDSITKVKEKHPKPENKNEKEV